MRRATLPTVVISAQSSSATLHVYRVQEAGPLSTTIDADCISDRACADTRALRFGSSTYQKRASTLTGGDPARGVGCSAA
jgi:hypothetical protein